MPPPPPPASIGHPWIDSPESSTGAAETRAGAAHERTASWNSQFLAALRSLAAGVGGWGGVGMDLQPHHDYVLLSTA